MSSEVEVPIKGGEDDFTYAGLRSSDLVYLQHGPHVLLNWREDGTLEIGGPGLPSTWVHPRLIERVVRPKSEGERLQEENERLRAENERFKARIAWLSSHLRPPWSPRNLQVGEAQTAPIADWVSPIATVEYPDSERTPIDRRLVDGPVRLTRNLQVGVVETLSIADPANPIATVEVVYPDSESAPIHQPPRGYGPIFEGSPPYGVTPSSIAVYTEESGEWHEEPSALHMQLAVAYAYWEPPR